MAEFQVLLSPPFKRPPQCRAGHTNGFSMVLPQTGPPHWFLSVCVCVCASLHLETAPQLEVPEVTGPVEDRGVAVPSHPRPRQGVAVSAAPPPCPLRLPPSSDGALPAGHKEGDWILERFRVRDDVPVPVRLHQHR